jgi:hypothetical protein
MNVRNHCRRGQAGEREVDDEKLRLKYLMSPSRGLLPRAASASLECEQPPLVRNGSVRANGLTCALNAGRPLMEPLSKEERSALRLHS